MKRMTMRRSVALLLITVMMTAMFGVSAFADTTAPTTAGKKAVFQQELVLEDGVMTPNATFTYAIAPGTADDTADPEVLAGLTGAKIDPVTFAPGDATEKNVTVDLSGVNFTAPGVYRYNITQSSVKAGFTADNRTLYLDVYVTVDDNGVVNGEYAYVLKDGTTKVEGFVNTYVTNNLTVTKTVKGNFSDRTDVFTFTVALETATANAGDKYTVEVAGAAADPLTVGEDGTVSKAYTLQHGQSLVIKGLTVDTTYEVTESNADEYFTSINDVTSSDRVAKGENMNADTTLAYVNEKTVQPATGIIMTFAPYVLMLAAAAAIGFVFLRRRQREM